MMPFSFKEFSQTLQEQVRHYPLMKPQDAVKLCYQRAFGAAHFCGGADIALEALREECLGLSPDPSAQLFENIGGIDGACRLYLPGVLAADISLPLLSRAFALDAALTPPDKEWFKDALNGLLIFSKNNQFPFSYSEMETFLNHYKKQGYPTIRHSEQYHNTYTPHYRVFAGPVARLLPLIIAIDKQLKTLPDTERLSIALDGFSSSGKTTAAKYLAQIFEADVVHMDDFFLPSVLRTPERYAEPGGNVHYERFSVEVAPYLCKRKAFSYQVFECSRMDFGPLAQIGDGSVLFVEGAYALNPRCKATYGLTAFFDISIEEQEKRIRTRNGDELWHRFQDLWIPLEHAYAEAFNIRFKTDFHIV
ncbi:MAG: hypothetical protein ACLRZ7_05300 [Lachnospiraceae bacterium]